MTLAYNAWSDSIKVLVYSPSGDSILPDSSPILKVFFDVALEAILGDSSLLHIKDCILADPLAYSIPCETEDGCFYFSSMGIEEPIVALPKVFTVKGNYPNPFTN